MTPADILTKPELVKLTATLRAAMTTIMVNREVSQTITERPNFDAVRDGAKHLGRNALGLIEDVGNNGAACIAAMLAEELPEITEEMLASARCAVWATSYDAPGLRSGRAGVSSSWLSQLERVLVTGTATVAAGRTADDALAALEGRLLALFLATHRLRKLPAECRTEHMLVEDKDGYICARCGSRVEQ